jgi:lipoyl(octanoyl) transferase
LHIKTLGRCDFQTSYAAMQAFTTGRDSSTEDELWLCEHAPTFTLGLASKPEHLLNPGDIAVVPTNRGGQVTYHGPGQVVAYPLIDLRRLGIYVKEYVYRLEQAVIQTLGEYGLAGQRVSGAPGIYVAHDNHSVGPFAGRAKIAALGIKVSRHYAYHGVALNVAMDLTPFERINPCGYAGLKTVDLSTLGVNTDWADAAVRLSARLEAHLEAQP